MASQMLNRRELCDHAKPGRVPEEPSGTGIEITSVPSSQDRVTNLVESDEVLVADPRGSLTPAQMVDEKLLAQLGSCSRSLQPKPTDRLKDATAERL
jgi:hypothetical protein